MININTKEETNDIPKIFNQINSGKLIKGLYHNGPDFYLSEIKPKIEKSFQFLTNNSEQFLASKNDKLNLFSNFIDEIYTYFDN